MIRVVAGIIEQRHRLLICQRRQDQAFAGKWEFPGGKIFPSETPRAALVRELREELAVETKIGPEIFRIRHQYSEMENRVEISFFWAAVNCGTPRNVCFQQIRWVTRHTLPRYEFLAADRPLVNLLRRGFAPIRCWSRIGGQ